MINVSAQHFSVETSGSARVASIRPITLYTPLPTPAPVVGSAVLELSRIRTANVVASFLQAPGSTALPGCMISAWASLLGTTAMGLGAGVFACAQSVSLDAEAYILFKALRDPETGTDTEKHFYRLFRAPLSDLGAGDLLWTSDVLDTGDSWHNVQLGVILAGPLATITVLGNTVAPAGKAEAETNYETWEPMPGDAQPIVDVPGLAAGRAGWAANVYSPDFDDVGQNPGAIYYEQPKIGLFKVTSI